MRCWAPCSSTHSRPRPGRRSRRTSHSNKFRCRTSHRSPRSGCRCNNLRHCRRLLRNMADPGRRTPGTSFRCPRTSTLPSRWRKHCRGSTADSCRRTRRTFRRCKLVPSDIGSRGSTADRGRRTLGTCRRCKLVRRRRRPRGNTADPGRRTRHTCPALHQNRCTRTQSRSACSRSKLRRRRRRTCRRCSRCKPCRPRIAGRW